LSQPGAPAGATKSIEHPRVGARRENSSLRTEIWQMTKIIGAAVALTVMAVAVAAWSQVAVVSNEAKDMENERTHYRPKHRPNAPDLTFIIWAAIISTGFIILSIALGVGIDPDASMLVSP
jgi:hypothetical protein